MRPSLFQARLSEQILRCDVCRWRCELAPGDVGRCRVRRCVGDMIVIEADGAVSAATIGPIEDQRLWHFFPDMQVFNIGSYGTPVLTAADNPYAALPAGPRRELDPDRIAEFAEEHLCRGVVWTYNDPAVTLEWTLDGMRLARAASRCTALVSSGYFSPEALNAIAPYLDGLRLDLFGFSDEAYTRLSGLTDWRGILSGAEWLRQHWNTHIEATLMLQPGINDDDAQIEALAGWIVDRLGDLTPLHLLVAGEQPAAAEQPLVVAQRAGLAFVYGPDPAQATRCPGCGWRVIQREDGQIQLDGVVDDSCANCGAALGLRTSIFRRQAGYRRDD
jgi:pyruvate formate lyase activating enzyme